MTNAISSARRLARTLAGTAFAVSLIGVGALGCRQALAIDGPAPPPDATARCVTAADDGSRIAFVIGNAAYPEKPLRRPVDDARTLAEALRCAGYDVEVAEDLDRTTMVSALAGLYGRIGNGATVLFFFSGYGMQSARQTYLLPIDAEIASEDDIRRDGVSVDAILAAIDARGAKAKMAIIDASRQNPFEPRFRAAPAGLAPMTSRRALVISAVTVGTVISEELDAQGLFVQELVRVLRTPDLAAEDAFNRIRIGVSRATRAKQVPWISSSLTEELHLQPLDPALADYRTCGLRASARYEPPRMLPDRSAVAMIAACTRILDGQSLAGFANPIHAYGNRAAASMSIGDHAGAIEDYSRLIEHDGAQSLAYHERAMAWYATGAFDRAESDFDQAFRIDRSPDDLNNRCWTRAILGRLAEALADCDEALRLRPDSAQVLDSRGFVHLAMGELERAIADFDAALRLDRRLAPSFYGRGKAKHAMGDVAGAERDFAAAVALNPNTATELTRLGLPGAR